MKNKIFSAATALILYTSLTLAQSGAGGVGINQLVPDPSAALDIVSEDQGVLLPRLTTSAIQFISFPANGLLVYNIDDNSIYINRGTPTTPEWNNVGEDMKVGFLVYPDGGQQIQASTSTLVDFVFTLSGFNDGNHFDYSFPNHYLVPYDGVYQFNTNVTINLPVGVQWIVEIWVDDNVSGLIPVVSNASSPVDFLLEHSGTVSATLKLKQNSKVYAVVEQRDQTTPHNLSTNATYTWFSGHRLY